MDPSLPRVLQITRLRNDLYPFTFFLCKPYSESSTENINSDLYKFLSHIPSKRKKKISLIWIESAIAGGGLVRVVLSVQITHSRSCNRMGPNQRAEESTEHIEWMQSVIEDAKEKKVQSLVLRDWLIRMKEVAYEADDVLDEFAMKILQTIGETGSNKKGVKNASATSVLLAFHLKIGHKIKYTACKLDAIAVETSGFGEKL